jgi:hypothetical protein
MKKRIKVNFKDLENYIVEAVEKQIKEIEGNKRTVITTKKQLRSMIEALISEKLTGNAFNEMHELKNTILKEVQKITKSKWALSITNVGKKSDGSYIIKIVGSGNTKVNLLWGDALDGDFNFSTSTPLVAGDEFSTELYKFMLGMVEKKVEIIKILKEIETKIITDASEEITEEDTDEMGIGMDNGMSVGGGMGMGMGNGIGMGMGNGIGMGMGNGMGMGLGNRMSVDLENDITPDGTIPPVVDAPVEDAPVEDAPVEDAPVDMPMDNLGDDDDEVELTFDSEDEMPPTLPEPESFDEPIETPEDKLEKPLEKPKNVKI